jgi:hypothetical protein
VKLPVGGAVACALALSVTGCGVNAIGPPPTVAPTAPPASTPTVEVGFVVAVTPVATPVRKHSSVHPSPTAFKVPKTAYLQLIPASGPPANRTISVAGGHLPPVTAVQVVWSAGRGGASIEAMTQTDRKGRLHTAFAVPASPPGEYVISAQVHGSTRARARYRIFSAAEIAATVESTRKGEQISIDGRRFLAKVRVLLVAYPVLAGSKPIVLGTFLTDTHGKLHIRKIVRQLNPGQYDLRAWSVSQVSALMAEVFFQVDV